MILRIINYIMAFILLAAVSVPAGTENSPKSNPAFGQRIDLPKTSIDDAPNVEVAVHNVGDVWLTVTNVGQFGTGYLGAQYDPVSGMTTPSCIFPANSGLNYLYVGAFWIGAVVGRDTLVSIGVDDYYSVLEFWPGPNDRIRRRSIQNGSAYYSLDAKSEQDLIAVYSDTQVGS